MGERQERCALDEEEEDRQRFIEERSEREAEGQGQSRQEAENQTLWFQSSRWVVATGQRNQAHTKLRPSTVASMAPADLNMRCSSANLRW
jgi:hypothetical protein